MLKSAGDTAYAQNEARTAAFKRLLDAGWSQADAEKASRGKSAADIDAAAASRAGGSVVRDAQVVANPPTEVTPGADRLRTPVGGVGDGSVENRRASVNGVNGDTEEEQLQPVGLPPGQNRGPALTAGQGDGRREVQDSSSLSVSDQDASKEKKGESGQASPNSVLSMRVASGSRVPIVIMPPGLRTRPCSRKSTTSTGV